MTEEQNKLAELVALSEKATQGEWINVPEDNVIYTKELGYSIATIYTSSIVSEEERNANAALATALVNWFRANQAALQREPATEAVRDQALEEAANLQVHEANELETAAAYAKQGPSHWALKRLAKECLDRATAIRALKGKGASQRLDLDSKKTQTLQCGWCGNVFTHRCPDKEKALEQPKVAG